MRQSAKRGKRRSERDEASNSDGPTFLGEDGSDAHWAKWATEALREVDSRVLQNSMAHSQSLLTLSTGVLGIAAAVPPVVGTTVRASFCSFLVLAIALLSTIVLVLLNLLLANRTLRQYAKRVTLFARDRSQSNYDALRKLPPLECLTNAIPWIASVTFAAGLISTAIFLANLLPPEHAKTNTPPTVPGQSGS